MALKITAASKWAEFDRRVLRPAGILHGTTQYQETRRAFYAGMEAMLQINARVGEGDVSEDNGVRIMEDLTDEMRLFAEHLKAGRV